MVKLRKDRGDRVNGFIKALVSLKGHPVYTLTDIKKGPSIHSSITAIYKPCFRKDDGNYGHRQRQVVFYSYYYRYTYTFVTADTVLFLRFCVVLLLFCIVLLLLKACQPALTMLLACPKP